MPTVTEIDLLNDWSVEIHANRGRAVRSFHVELDSQSSEPDPTNSTGIAWAQLREVLDTQNIVPDPGSPHPFINALVVKSQQFRPFGPKDFRVRVEYGMQSAEDATPGDAFDGIMSVSSESGVRTVETNYGRPTQGGVGSGVQPITVLNPVTNQRQAETVQMEVPVRIVRIQQRANFNAEVSASTYVGTVNSSAWTPPLSSTAISQETSLCKSINSHTDDRGRTWINSYVFEVQRRDIGNSNFASGADPYDVVIAPTDDATGRPLAEKPDGTPITDSDVAIYELYPKRDHGSLF